MLYAYTNTPVKGFRFVILNYLNDRKKYTSVCELLYPSVELEYNLCTLSVERILVEIRKIDVVNNYTMVFKRVTNTANDLKTFTDSDILHGKVFLINTQVVNIPSIYFFY